MQCSPLISVIIPFYNAGSWLAEAIESAISQTYQNVEIILVDDGSTKDDADVAMQYAITYPGKIFYLQHAGHVNKGLPATRNLGIKKADGELVAFLDADDKWMPQKLERQVFLFNQYPQVQVICEASVFWFNWKNANCENNITYIGTPQGVYQPTELMKKLYPLGEGQPPCPSGIIIRKDALQRCGGFEEKFSGIYQLYEDQAFLSKIYANEIIYISNEANNYYRKREDSMSSAANDEVLYNKVRLFYCGWLEDYFAASTNTEIKKLITDFKKELVLQRYTSGITA